MSMQLKKLENGRWKNEETSFNECVTLCSLLSKHSPSIGEWSPYKSTTNRFGVFLSTYCQAFDIESGFSWWKTKLFAFALRSSNLYAASIVAQEIIHCQQNLSTTNAFNTINEN